MHGTGGDGHSDDSEELHLDFFGWFFVVVLIEMVDLRVVGESIKDSDR